MKHLKTYKIFEAKEEIDYIGLILSNLSDTKPNLNYTRHGGRILLYDLNLINKDIDEDELASANGRLEDEGWTILNVCRDARKVSYNNITLDDTIYCSIIRTDLLNNLKSKGVKFWNDLIWEEWDLNKSTHSYCLQSKFYTKDGEYISIIDGTKGVNNKIDWIEIIDIHDENRYSNPVEAEIKLITLQ